MKKRLKVLYQRLYATFGPQHWWPGSTPFEVTVGAILTQNTSWHNVEKAIQNLKTRGVLTPARMHALSQDTLARLIRPAGYFNIKARRLKHFLNFLFTSYAGDLKKMRRLHTDTMRRELLGVNGIGPETADSIILYAFKKPAFAVDAYTKRIFKRLGIISEKADYAQLQRLFTDNLPLDQRLFNEYHALLVRLGKDLCLKSSPRCKECPLRRFMCAGFKPAKED